MLGGGFNGWMVRPIISEPKHRNRHESKAPEETRSEFDFGAPVPYQELNEKELHPGTRRTTDLLFRVLFIVVVAPFVLLVLGLLFILGLAFAW